MELVEILRAVFALCAVLGMIGISAFIAKKSGLTTAKFNMSRDKRLSLVETLPLDKRRKAAVIRIDNEEHLVILNPNSVTVVARNLPSPLPTGDLEEEKPQELPVFADALATLKTFSDKPSSLASESFDVKAAIPH